MGSIIHPDANHGTHTGGSWNWNTGGPGPRVMAAETLEGDTVKSTSGETLGKIEHIMIDVPSGRVAYAVMSFGGFLGVGDKLFAVPWRALSLDAERQCFILHATRERLNDLPGFDKDNWPTFPDEGLGLS